MKALARQVARLVADKAGASSSRPLVVGVTGPVAVGKTAFAGELARLVEAESGRRVSVVSTDGFLLPNAVLVERGLLARKGFPETYDAARFAQFVDELRAGHAVVRVPLYSHEAYDVVGEAVDLDVGDVVVLEGLNVLHDPVLATRFDLTIYIDAEGAALREWYVERFRALCEEARHDGSSFFRWTLDLDPATIDRIALDIWSGINEPNNREHIAPLQARADVVVTMDGDHRVVDVREAARGR